MNREHFSGLIQKARRIVIKIGSARIAASLEETNDFLFSLCSDVRQLRDQGKQITLVSSGAIAQGKRVLEKYENPDLMSLKEPGLKEKQALAAIGQSRLMKLYESFFSKVNINIAQILFGEPQVLEPHSLENLHNTFEQLLSWNILPIVNENDSIATDEIKVGDNDLLSAMVSLVISADLLIILTGVDGFLKEGELISFLEGVEEKELSFAHGPEGPGTGGMHTKLKAGGILAKYGIPTAIINGKEKNAVYRLMTENRLGTLIVPKTEKANPQGEDTIQFLRREFKKK